MVPSRAYWTVDAKNYTATLHLSDGSLGPPLELRALFAQFLAEVSGRNEN
jgi:hypothetical protein